MNVMIVGGGGLLGQKLIEVFKRETAFRITSVIRSGIADANGAVYFDTSSRAAWKEITLQERWRPDFIINAADATNRHHPTPNREQIWRAGVTLVELLADVCRRIDAHLIQVSCDSVFDGSTGGPYHEEHRPQPHTYLGKAKLAAENICRQTGIKHLILRTMWLYGAADGRTPYMVGVVEHALTTKVPLILSQLSTGTPTRTDDVAYAIVRAVETAAEGVVHIAGPQIVTQAAFARAIAAAATRSRGPQLTIISPAEDEPTRSGLITVRARGALDIKPLPLDTGLEAYYIQRDRKLWRVH